MYRIHIKVTNFNDLEPKVIEKSYTLPFRGHMENKVIFCRFNELARDRFIQNHEISLNFSVRALNFKNQSLDQESYVMKLEDTVYQN